MRRNTVFSPGSNGLSGRSPLGGSTEKRLVLVANRREEAARLCAERLTPLQNEKRAQLGKS